MNRLHSNSANKRRRNEEKNGVMAEEGHRDRMGKVKG